MVSENDKAWEMLCQRLGRDPATSEESDTCSLRAAWKAMIAFSSWNTRAPADLRSALEAETIERCAKVAEEQAQQNAQARRDRADDALAFEFDGLGSVIATAIRALAPTKEPAA